MATPETWIFLSIAVSISILQPMTRNQWRSHERVGWVRPMLISGATL